MVSGSAPSENMEVAVALFERGFPEDRIEEALKHCKTLTEAVAWLCSGPGAIANRGGPVTRSMGAAAAAAGSLAEAKAAGQPLRRRTAKKVGPAIDRAAEVSGQPSSVSTAVATSPPASTTTGGAGEEGASPTFSTFTAEGLGESPAAKESVLIIEPRDASNFWQQAAARWPKLAAGGSKVEGSARLEPSPPAETPKRKTPEAAESAAATEAAEEVTVTARARQEEGADSASRRPPATPQAQAEAPARSPAPPSSGKAPGSGANSTPGSSSSPGAMKLSKDCEICSICCDDCPAKSAVRLGCSHGWYCATCMVRHAEARLAQGAASITCPECYVAVAERDLRRLLPSEIIDRLLARSLEQAVSSAADLWACPTPNCPMRVALADGELARLNCPECKKTCCLRCGAQPYHRGLTCEEHADRKRAKGTRKDEDLLNKWIQETGTKQCPTCRMAVTKQNLAKQHTQYQECHKMSCRNCGTRFCFKCLAVLTETYTCGCSIDAHGFIDPVTGKRCNHLRRGAKRKAGK